MDLDIPLVQPSLQQPFCPLYLSRLFCQLNKVTRLMIWWKYKPFIVVFNWVCGLEKQWIFYKTEWVLSIDHTPNVHTHDISVLHHFIDWYLSHVSPFDPGTPPLRTKQSNYSFFDIHVSTFTRNLHLFTSWKAIIFIILFLHFKECLPHIIQELSACDGVLVNFSTCFSWVTPSYCVLSQHLHTRYWMFSFSSLPFEESSHVECGPSSSISPSHFNLKNNLINEKNVVIHSLLSNNHQSYKVKARNEY